MANKKEKPVPFPLSVFFTQIGKYNIPVLDGKNTSFGYFKDIGYCAFWTCVLKDKVPAYGLPKSKRKFIFGRAKLGLSAGDRFDRMSYEQSAEYIPPADKPVYKHMWNAMLQKGANVYAVRPSTLSEVQRWIASHPVQCKHLKFFEVKKKVYSRDLSHHEPTSP